MTPKIQQTITPRQHRNKPCRHQNKPSRQFRYSPRYSWPNSSFGSATITLIFGLVIVAGVALLGFLYLGQVLNTASQGSDIQQLEEKIVELKEQQKEIELEGARLRSIDTIEEKVQQLNLINTTKVTFLGPTPDKVAALPN